MKEGNEKIYLDWAASAPVREEVLEKTADINCRVFGNPSSAHAFGQEARAVIDEAREKIAAILECKTDEIFFTSGGTESNNTAIRGIVSNANLKSQISKSQIKIQNQVPHIVTTTLEHQAVYNTCKDLEKNGQAAVTYLKPDNNGVVQVKQVLEAIRPETVLVSVIYVSNELGTVQPVREIGRALDKLYDETGQKILLHTDAVQAAEYLLINVKYLHVDLMTLAGHKIGGLKGSGILYIKKGTKIQPLITGGAQELDLRAGSENIAGIAGMAIALEECVKEQKEGINEKTARLRDKLEQGIKQIESRVLIVGEKAERSPAIATVIFPKTDGAKLAIALDIEGLAVSSGSACASGSQAPSHILQSLELKAPYDCQGVRFSLGYGTKESDIKQALEIINRVWNNRKEL